MKGEKRDDAQALSSAIRLVAIGTDEPRVFRLVARRIEVGRAAASDLRIDHDSVSERHAGIRRGLGGYLLKDRGSTQGTFVNGRRIKGSVTIRPGDEIRFGAVRFALVRGPGQIGSVSGAPATAAILLAAVFLAVGYLATRFVQTWNRIDAPAETGKPSNTPVAAATSPASPATTATPAPTPTAAHAEASAKPTPAAPHARATRVSSAPRATAHTLAVASGHSKSDRSEVALPRKTAAPRPILTPAPSPDAYRASAGIPLPPASPAAAPGPWDTWPKPTDWLGWINSYRKEAGLKPVVADAKLSEGDEKHATYIVRNYFAGPRLTVPVGPAMHQETPGNQWYTPEGAEAGASSDVMPWGRLQPAVPERFLPSRSVNEWIGTPFHRLPILDPGLRSVGYGQYCAPDRTCAAALNATSGRDPVPMGTVFASAVEFPAPNSTVCLMLFSSEWPNPLTSCPGYQPPVGIPITIELGNFVKRRLMSYSLTRDGSPVEACGFDTNTYANPDARTQSRARQILSDFGAVVIVPRKPLVSGSTYHVSATVDGRDYAWSFHVGTIPAQASAR